MSLYYKQSFVSPEPIYSEVKELLKSYFTTGAIDDLLFPKWVSQCLARFRKSAFRIDEVLLEVNNFKACLPEDFAGVREAWMCTVYDSDPINAPFARYYQEDCRIGTTDLTSCDECFDTSSACDTSYMVTHKVTGTFMFTFTKTFLLRPGNMSTSKYCGAECKNLYSQAPYTFDIKDGDLLTSYECGSVYLLYYADASKNGQEMIPDNFWVQNYIRKFLIYKCFEQLSHQVMDETYNQIEKKKEEYNRQQAEAFILAETDLKKQTAYEKIRQIGVNYRSANKYKLP